MSRAAPAPRLAGTRLAATLLTTPALAAQASSPAEHPSADPTIWTVPACHRPAASAVTATFVPDRANDIDLTSFDGTRIRAHWFPAPGASSQRPAPTVFYGPGFGSAGDTDTTAGKIPLLHQAGYNVLTWDPRGFGASEGAAEIDSPMYEACDVSHIIDWIADQSGVALDHRGDPRMGMVGGSYGGGIQWITAATDCRVDAIVPQISWNSLLTSLDSHDTFKTGWANLLALIAAQGGTVDPHVTQTIEQGNGPDGRWSDASRRWYADRGPDWLLDRIHDPTLIEQGTVDTLFSLAEADHNYRALAARGVPVSMLWYCGGHGICLTDHANSANDKDPQRAEVAWLNRWVKRDHTTDTGPAVTLVDQNGIRYGATHYPVPAGRPLTATGHGTLPPRTALRRRSTRRPAGR
ncbi:alpha/beta hydrolase family protein [Streptomyces chartreusis]|uniref:alpha/beta hydrolase family protein n=1 Tax=Streptomyces chartreusis TaxID=1969 RepID=UPI00371ED9AA